MKKYTVEIDLPGGETIDYEVEASSAEEAVQKGTAEQQRLIAEQSRSAPPPPRIADTLWQNTMDVFGEGAAAFNRSAMEGLDFFGPGSVNAAARLSNQHLGTDFGQLPTFAGAHAQTPGAMGGFMDPGMARDAVIGLGEAAPAAAGFSPVAGRNIASPSGALMDFIGLGAAKTPAPLIAGMPEIYGNPTATMNDMLPSWSPAARNADEVAGLVASGSDDIARANRLLDPYTGGARPNPAADKAMKQGLSERFTALVAAADEPTRAKLREMTEIQEGYRRSARFGAENRPSDVAGASLLDRVSVLKQVNQRARSEFDPVIDSLRGETVDVNQPVSRFMAELDRMGLKPEIDPETGSVLLDALGSDIEGLRKPIKVIERVMTRMASGAPGEPVTAHDVHRLKRFLDENLSWGQKNITGIDGNVERILKGLRHDLDTVLDDAFPEYNRVNTEYSETRQAIGALEDAIGKRIDLDASMADSALGTALRPLFGNRVSRQMLTNSVMQVDDTAKKYASKMRQGTEIVPFRRGALTPIDPPPDLDDDLLSQVMYASELENIFGSAAPNSFLGDLGKAAESTAINSAAFGVSSGAATAAQSIPRALWNQARGVNPEDAAMKALRELLGMK